MFNIKILPSLLTLAAAMTSAPLSAQTNHVLTTATTPVSTPAQLAEWQRVVSDQFGVAGRDSVGHKIGPNIAKRSFVGLNWYPVDIYKQTLCGTLHHFNFYDGWGDEADWNNYVIPHEKFSYLLEDVRPIADPDEIHSCGQPGNCMEAEVTPDEHFYENPWFTKSTERSVRDGRPICTYGPWVWEEAHGNRPEIHPSELYWWKDDVAGSEAVYTLMVLQDDSNRFDRSDNFNGNILQPWSKVPRTAEFKIAFKVNIGAITPTLRRLRFDIDELDGRNVVTKNDSAARRDSDDGKNHAIQFDGSVILEVNELQSEDDNIGVKFVEVTRTGTAFNQSLQGYIAITTKVGVDDRGKEGYHVLRVRARTISVQPPIDPTPNVVANRDPNTGDVAQPAAPQPTSSPVLVKPVRKSIKFANVDGRPALVAEVQLRASNGETLGKVENVNLLRGGVVEIPSARGGC